MAETTTNSPTLTADATPVKETPATAPRPDETPLEALASYCAVIVVGLFILTFIFQNFVIPSGSM
jgi:signal peptidase I